MGENTLISESIDEDAMFFDELFIAEDEKGPDNQTGNNPSTSSPQSNEKTHTFKKMSNFNLQKMEERAAMYIDHDLVKDSKRTDSDGWVIPSTESKKESSNDAVMDYRIELENYRGSSPPPEEPKKPRRRKKNKKKKTGKLSEKAQQSKAYKIYASKIDCAFFKQGNCYKGSECLFRHHMPVKKKILCKHYVNDTCKKGLDCNFMHSEFPCKYFHTNAECFAKEKCRFSHKPLTYEMKKILHEYLNPKTSKCETPKEHPALLGDPTLELKESNETKKWQEEMKNLQLQKSIYSITIPTEKQKMPEKVESSTNSSNRQLFYQDTFVTPASPTLPSVVKQEESRLVSANEMSSIFPHTSNFYKPSFFACQIGKTSDEMIVKKEETEENSVSLAKNLSIPLHSLNKSAITDQDKSVTLGNGMYSDTEVSPESASNISFVTEPPNFDNQQKTTEAVANYFPSDKNIEKTNIDATQEMLSCEIGLHSDDKSEKLSCENGLHSDDKSEKLSCENGLHSDDKSKKPSTLHPSRLNLKRKLLKDWKLKLNREEIKAAYESKVNEDSLIPWKNPALVSIPEWPSLTEMLIRVDLKILNEKNVSKAKKAKRMLFFENLILEAYDSYQLIENDNSSEASHPQSKKSNCFLSSTKSNDDSCLKPLNVQNNCQNACVSEGYIHHNTKSIKRPFSMNNMPVLPFIKMESNDALVHSSPNESVTNNEFPLLSVKNESTLERTNSKVLPPTQELMLKYQDNKSLKAKQSITFHPSFNFTDSVSSKKNSSSKENVLLQHKETDHLVSANHVSGLNNNFKPNEKSSQSLENLTSDVAKLHPVEENFAEFPVSPYSSSLLVKPSLINELSHKIKKETFNPIKSSSELPCPDSKSSDLVGEMVKVPLPAKSQNDKSPDLLESSEVKSLPTSHLPKSISDPRMAQLRQSRTLVTILQNHTQARENN